MCGINGIFAYNHVANPIARTELSRTRDHMAARGPDGKGEWISADGRVGFGHRRLSIIDLSDAGAQPMANADSTLIVTFNGEIYNYSELRRGLEANGYIFRSNADTEVLLHLYAEKGARMVRDLRGMFAFAIWDMRRAGVFIARDLYGIKPLYTANDGWTFRFASQVKALLAGGAVSRDPEPAGVVGFHLWGSVPEPFTLYREIQQLPAGHTQWIDAAGPREPNAYASLAAIYADGARDRIATANIPGVIIQGFRESVQVHLLADVEVGVFLSAGVDSGAILGMMRDAGQANIRAITLVFDEFRNTTEDEAPLASEIARRYGAEHIMRTISESEFRSELPAIIEAMDQPSIDGVNTWFVAKAAREAGLKVALSGVGGDELLGGYPSFHDIPRWVARLKIPAAIPGLGGLSRRLLRYLNVASNKPKAVGLLEYGGNYAGAYLLRRGLLMPFELSHVMDVEMARDGLNRLAPLDRVKATLSPDPGSDVARVAALESAGYLRNQLLRDADWAGMAHSLEIRTPLVDSELLKRAARVMPQLMAGYGKSLLAAAPSRPLPDAIVDRVKTGFGVPTGRWLKTASVGAHDHKGLSSRAWALRVLTGFNEQAA